MRDNVEVVIEDQRVRIFHGTELVATHARSTEPFARIVDVAHYAGLWRSALDDRHVPGLAVLGRDLADYAGSRPRRPCSVPRQRERRASADAAIDLAARLYPRPR